MRLGRPAVVNSGQSNKESICRGVGCDFVPPPPGLDLGCMAGQLANRCDLDSHCDRTVALGGRIFARRTRRAQNFLTCMYTVKKSITRDR